MTTEQPTELEDIDDFFRRGELEPAEGVAETNPAVPELDDGAVVPLSAAQLGRRARLRRLVLALVAPLGIASLVLLGVRVFDASQRPGWRRAEGRISVINPESHRPGSAQGKPAWALSAASFATVQSAPTRLPSEPSRAEVPDRSLAVPASNREALRRGARRQPARVSAPSPQVSVAQRPAHNDTDRLPTARFPSSASN